jgi:hypothetical protein
MARVSALCVADAASYEDGYVRLTFQRLCRLPFARRMSVCDAELRGDLIAQDVPAQRAGYCEWIDTSTALRISIGWAWFATDTDTSQLLAPGGFSGNVMIVSDDGSDLGPSKTNELLKSWLSAQIWQQGLREAWPLREMAMSVH